MNCPKCRGSELLGMYAAFWAVLDSKGNDTANNFSDYVSDTEITDRRKCRECGHECTEEELTNE